MCGISAWFDLKKRERKQDESEDGYEHQRAKLEAQLDDSVESMRHRGPNAKGIWISPDNSTGLGHVRLSTRDLSSAGHQPLQQVDLCSIYSSGPPRLPSCHMLSHTAHCWLKLNDGAWSISMGQ